MGTVGVATFPGTFPGFPAGVTSGTYNGTWDLALASSYTSTFLAAQGGTAAGAEAGLINAVLEGKAYVNIHTTFAPGGEIRGFLQQVPEPASLVVWGLFGAISSVGYARLRRWPTRSPHGRATQ
jgi:hypothetical protein